jgi:hypothetical protein
VEGFGKALRDIAKHVDINLPEDVKEYIAKKNSIPEECKMRAY